MNPEEEEEIDPEMRKITQLSEDPELPPEELCDVMISYLKSHQLLIRSSAVHQLVSLGKSHSQMAIPKILTALDPSIDYWTVRFGAVEALGEIANETTVKPLIEYLKSDEDPDFRAMVAKQLGEMGNVAKGASSGLISALDDKESSEIQENAAHALGQIKALEAVEPLINALKTTQDEYARREMCWGLGELKDPKAVPILIKALKDRDKNTRRNSAEALGKIQHNTSILPLLEATKASDVDIQAKAIWGLKQYNSDVIISEIEKAAEGDGLVAIQYYNEYLFNVENESITSKVKKIKEPILVGYRDELSKIKADLESCIVFVSENFQKLANLSQKELQKLLQKEIPPIESKIG
ncbi:MAG: HEAT repeat domain-containing protein, partial [Candidatus Hodarchaeales archaeon]